MYIWFSAIFVGLPLIGVAMMEGGAYGPSIGQDGYVNGATLAYACYLAIFIAFTLATARGGRSLNRYVVLPYADREFWRVAKWALALNVGFIVVLFFGFGAIDVLRNVVSKQEFRVSLGAFGSVAFMITKVIAPLLLAYLAALWPVTTQTYELRLILVANFMLVLIAGLSWGFKTTSITMVMPAIILLYWRVRLRELALLGGVVFGIIGALFYWFDQDTETSVSVAEFFLRRLTTYQGDVSWLVWGMYADGQTLPAYARTLIVAIGDKMFALLFDIEKADYQIWVDYHYDLLLTALAGAPLDQIEGGHSITGTPFSEGLIAAGLPGVIFFAVSGGLLTGWLYRLIGMSRNGRSPVRAAVGATYASVVLFPWLNGGAVVQLFHIAVAIGFGIALAAVFMVRRLRLGIHGGEDRRALELGQKVAHVDT